MRDFFSESTCFRWKKMIYPSLCFRTIGLSHTIRVPYYKPVLSVTSVVFEREMYLQLPEQSSLNSMILLISICFRWYEKHAAPAPVLGQFTNRDIFGYRNLQNLSPDPKWENIILTVNVPNWPSFVKKKAIKSGLNESNFGSLIY